MNNIFIYQSYKFLSYLFHFFSNFYLRIRVVKKKEDIKRFKEKIGKYKIKNNKNTVWFHASSLGEIKSISPLIIYYNKIIKKKILITTATLSSAKYCHNFFKSCPDIIHQFSPIDTPIAVKKFLNHWKPEVALITESELWPNLIFETKKRCKLILLNARLSRKSFNRWKYIKNFARIIFLQFNLIIAQSKETKKFIEYFNVNKIKYFGNLKFYQNENKKVQKKIKITNKKFQWVAMSTHSGEEEILFDTIKILKSKKHFFQCILVPRHIDRIKKIINVIKKNNLTYKIYDGKKDKTLVNDILIINTYGQASIIFEQVKTVYMGGSFVRHGGQNPLEPAMQNCKIFHGKHVENFTEIYKYLKKNNISKIVNNQNHLAKELINISKKKSRFSFKKILKLKSKKILLGYQSQLDQYLK